MSFPIGSVMTPRELMIDPTQPRPPPRKFFTSLFRRIYPKKKVTVVAEVSETEVIDVNNPQEYVLLGTFEWTAAEFAELANTPIGQIYDQPGFVTDAGIEKYMSMCILTQYPDRFVPNRHGQNQEQESTGTEGEGSATANNDHVHLGSTSSAFSFVEGEDAITVRNHRLSPPDPYQQLVDELANANANDLATGHSSDNSDTNSSAAPSLAEDVSYEIFIASSEAVDQASSTMPHEGSQDMASDSSTMQQSAPSSTRAIRPEDSGSRTPSIRSISASSSQSGETIAERYKLKGVTVDGKKYYIREHPEDDDNASIKTVNSFANLTIQELMEQHPQLQADLETLKKSIEEHDRDLRRRDIVGQQQLQHQVDT